MSCALGLRRYIHYYSHDRIKLKQVGARSWWIHTIEQERRQYSAAFKAEEWYRQPGCQLPPRPLARSININLLRRWFVEARRAEGISDGCAQGVAASSEAFVVFQ